MKLEDFDCEWRTLSEDVITGMKEWRLQHPKATFREIEAALDERLGKLRARMLESAALASRAADWGADAADDPPRCVACGEVLRPRGRRSGIFRSKEGERWC